MVPRVAAADATWKRRMHFAFAIGAGGGGEFQKTPKLITGGARGKTERERERDSFACLQPSPLLRRTKRAHSPLGGGGGGGSAVSALGCEWTLEIVERH